MKKKIILISTLCTLILSACGDISQSNTDDVSSDVSKGQETSENVSTEETAREIYVSTSIGNPFEEDLEWTIEDEKIKQEIFDWYNDFLEQNYQPVELDAQNTLAGGKQVTITFNDLDGNKVVITNPGNTGAKVNVNGQPYKCDSSVLDIALETEPQNGAEV